MPSAFLCLYLYNVPALAHVLTRRKNDNIFLNATRFRLFRPSILLINSICFSLFAVHVHQLPAVFVVTHLSVTLQKSSLQCLCVSYSTINPRIHHFYFLIYFTPLITVYFFNLQFTTKRPFVCSISFFHTFYCRQIITGNRQVIS